MQQLIAGGPYAAALEKGAAISDAEKQSVAEHMSKLTGLSTDYIIRSNLRVQPNRFQRELRYVFTPAGRSIDAALLDEGYAHAWREDGALKPILIPIEEAAHAAHRGCLWSK